MTDFIGYPLFVDPADSVMNTATQDAYIFSQMDNSTQYLVNFRAAYDCPNWNGENQRFHMSYYQGLLTFLAQNSKKVTPCKSSSTTISTNKFVCQTTCQMARMALNDIFANPQFCNQNSAAAVMAQRQSTLATYDSNCALFPTTNCLSVVSIEAEHAGFPRLADAVEYCQKNATDSLCSFLGAETEMDVKTTKNLLISGIVLAVLVLSGMVVTLIYCLRNSGPGGDGSDGKFVDLDKQPMPFRGPVDMDAHKEPHFQGAEIIRDVVVGLSDGLTVPFALTAGLSSLGNSKFVVLAGVSELVAGSISMGLGGYLGGKSEIEHYNAEKAREWQEVMSVPEVEEQEIVDLFSPYGMSRREMEPLLKNLRNNPELWVEFMMTHELAMEKPESSRLWISALTVGGSYFMGGLVPLIPYMIIANSQIALYVSIGSTLAVLFVFGYVKAKLIGVNTPWRSAFEMLFVGAAAGGAAFGIAKALPAPV
ncbi:UNVERIFIED_CONTAM: hypothetical protein HDU68_008136 [Siphonaria sp. JEL0065]|nr:hypothetical protein HDU68_008136 [Siphonaria sp. JEL0065]